MGWTTVKDPSGRDDEGRLLVASDPLFDLSSKSTRSGSRRSTRSQTVQDFGGDPGEPGTREARVLLEPSQLVNDTLKFIRGRGETRSPRGRGTQDLPAWITPSPGL